MRNLKFILTFFSIALSALLMNGCSKNSTTPIVPPPPPPGSGNILQNVVYGKNINVDGQMETLDMDIYFPPNMQPGKKYPLVMHMHGGGYSIGTKDNSAGKCLLLADSGFIAATINYRLGWDNGPGVCAGDMASLYEAAYRAIQDANAAMRFLVSKADAYQIDTNWIFESGASAGGSIALTSTYMTDAYVQATTPDVVAKLGGLNNQGNNLTNTFSVKGICSIGGSLQDSTLINSNKAVPTIFFQGGADQTIPVDTGTYLMCPNYIQLFGSLCLYRQLEANGKPVVAHILPGADHGNNGDSGFSNDFMMSNTACFFHSLMKKGPLQNGIYYGTINSCK